MNIIEVQKTGIAQNPHGVDVRRIFEGDKVQVAHITLKPGEQLKKHTTPTDVLFYVLEGTGIVEIGDEKKEVDKDTLIDSPAKIPHCWYNEGTDTLRVLLIRL